MDTGRWFQLALMIVVWSLLLSTVQHHRLRFCPRGGKEIVEETDDFVIPETPQTDREEEPNPPDSRVVLSRVGVDGSYNERAGNYADRMRATQF